MLQIVLTAALLVTSIGLHALEESNFDHVDRSPAEMYIRSVDEFQQDRLLERHRRQSNQESRDMFVTQCDISDLEPEGEPSINVKGIGLNRWDSVEKAASLIHLMVRFMPRTIFRQLAANSSVGLFSVVSLPTLVFDEFKDIGNCLASCAGDCFKWCTNNEYTYYPNYPLSYLWAYGNMSRTFVVENNVICEGYNPSNGNENYLVREYGLTVMTRGISPTTAEEIVNAFLTAKAAGKWPQIRNHYEYFMKATLVWFDASQQSTQGGMACEAQFACGETNPRHRLYLKQEDPELYRLLNYIYNNNREYLNSDTATCSWRNF